MRWIAIAAVLACGCIMPNPNWDEDVAADTEGGTDSLGGTDTSAPTATATDTTTAGGTDTMGDPVPPDGVAALCSGYEHSCMLQGDGSLYCWGSNRFGQIGDGTTSTAHEPVPIALPFSATDVACGAQTTCATLSDGSAFCWGLNDDGILGYTGERENPSPTRVPGATGLSSISMGNNHACARTAGDGRVTCWGGNSAGQSGTDVPGAHMFGDLSGITQIAAGDYHNCVLLEDATVQCWGDAKYGKTGVPYDEEVGAQLTPVDVGLTGVVRVDSGENHSCALRDDATLWCWGSNGSGQLGPDIEDDSVSPVQFAGLTGVVAFSAGDDHTCAALDSGVTHCHGASGYGRLGNTVPLVFAQITKLAAGQNHTCAVDDQDQVWCFGADYHGQLGQGPRWSVPEPTRVDLTGVTQIDTHYDFTCALNGQNSARCWGENGHGQLGDGTDTDRATPVSAVSMLDGTVTDIAVGADHACAVDTSNQTWCWGYGYYGQLGDGLEESSKAPVAALTGAVDVVAGNHHTCAVDLNQDVWCWGLGTSGQLGDGLEMSSNTPVQVMGLSGVTDIASGSDHTCALSDGQMWCWGNNSSGELGDGTRSDALVPIRPNDGNLSFVSLSLGESTTCAVSSVADLWCWGDNYEYMMGNPELAAPHSPEKAIDLTDVTDTVSVGYDHSCVVQGGTVACSGSNSFGQLGDGTYARRSQHVDAKTNIASVVTGTSHTCVLDNSGSVFCFGTSYTGHLGTGTIARDTDVPVRVTFPG